MYEVNGHIPVICRSSELMSETESEAEDVWQQQQVEELQGRYHDDKDRSGFLRMINRSHVYNSSSYSLYSISGSMCSGMNGQTGSLQRRKSAWANQPVRELYSMLIGPFEDTLMKYNSTFVSQRELVLVLQGDLYLVPFAVLRGENDSDYLFERFTLVVVPSIRDMLAGIMTTKVSKPGPDSIPALVIGNPKLPVSVCETWQWGELRAAEQELDIVADMLGTKSIQGKDATKGECLNQIANAECIHIAAHVSWKLSAIVLSPGECVKSETDSSVTNVADSEEAELHDSSSDISSSMNTPALSEFLLTAADILNIQLTAKLVVLTGGDAKVSSDGVVGLMRALLAAGAQCVVVPLWSAPSKATQLLMKTFYNSLMQGLYKTSSIS